jgi:hypothetical protein
MTSSPHPVLVASCNQSCNERKPNNNFFSGKRRNSSGIPLSLGLSEPALNFFFIFVYKDAFRVCVCISLSEPAFTSVCWWHKDEFRICVCICLSEPSFTSVCWINEDEFRVCVWIGLSEPAFRLRFYVWLVYWILQVFPKEINDWLIIELDELVLGLSEPANFGWILWDYILKVLSKRF